jgi:hypothetical protein
MLASLVGFKRFQESISTRHIPRILSNKPTSCQNRKKVTYSTKIEYSRFFENRIYRNSQNVFNLTLPRVRNNVMFLHNKYLEGGTIMYNKGKKVNENSKNEQLEQFRVKDEGKQMTTNQGLKVSEDEFSLKAGERGPTLMEDFHFREKMTHFDHERIPEHIVHARGYAAHGIVG